MRFAKSEMGYSGARPEPIPIFKGATLLRTRGSPPHLDPGSLIVICYCVNWPSWYLSELRLREEPPLQVVQRGINRELDHERCPDADFAPPLDDGTRKLSDCISSSPAHASSSSSRRFLRPLHPCMSIHLCRLQLLRGAGVIASDYTISYHIT